MSDIQPWLRPRYLAWRKEYEKTPAFREKKRLYFAARRKDPEYRKLMAKYQQNYKKNNWLRVLAMRAIRRAVSRGLDCDREYMLALGDQEVEACQCCASQFDIQQTSRKYRAKERAPTLDRIDTTKGYVVGNVGVICWRCNRIKSDGSPQDLKAILAYMGDQ